MEPLENRFEGLLFALAGEYLSRGPCQLIAECVCVDDGEGVSVCVFEACCQPAVRGEQSSSTP